MKNWKKALSLILSALMLVAMFPASILTANALDYSKTNFAISNLSDWYAIAESEENFVGKKVKLLRDIDAGGAELPTLFGEFGGTFDGLGHTIRNFKATGALIAEKTLSGSVIKNLTVNGTVTNLDEGTLATGLLVVQHSDTNQGSLTVSDVTVEGSVTGASQQVGGVFGVLTLRDGQTATLQNINIGATVLNNRTDLTHACISAGGVVGIFEPIGRTELTVRNANVSGTVRGSRTAAGGILGSIFSSDHLEDLYAGGTITISNCEVSGKIFSGITHTVIGVGGIIGSFGGFKHDFAEFTAFDGELNIQNCAIVGRIGNTNGLHQLMSVGGVLGSYSYQHATVNIDHCLISADFPSNSLTVKDGSGAALILGTGASQRLSNLNINNTVTTHEEFSLVGAVIGHEVGHLPHLVLNGKNCQSISSPYPLGNYKYSGAITDSSVKTVSETAAETMIQKDALGFVKKVGGHLTALGVQDNVPDGATLTSQDRYAIRLILLPYAEGTLTPTVTVVAHNTASGEELNSFTVGEVKLYDRLTAYDANGVKTQSYRADEYGAEKFVTLILDNIPAGAGYTFEITPEYTMADGRTVLGEAASVTYDVNGQCIASSLDVKLPMEPTIRVMSSNILIADARGYHLDDIHNATGEVYDPAKDDGRNSTVIYKDGLNYYWYFRDDQTGEHFGRENGNRGFWNEERMQYMAEMYAAYQPDFIGLQEVYGGTVINTTPTINMQQMILSYLGNKYAYVDYTNQVPVDAHYDPILYRTDKWRVIAKDIADSQWTEYANPMHRWQWALFESLENPDWKFIVLNLHGPNNLAGADLQDFQPTFFASVNAQLKMLEERYPNIPIAMTGDFNQPLTSSMITAALDQTSLTHSMNLTVNFEIASTIDHIFVTPDHVTVEQMRVVDNKFLRKSSDHYATYSDFKYKQ